MPYLNNKIHWESHKEDGPNPLAKRLYIRDYDKNGKQRFVPWGITCTNCGATIIQKYEHNLTKKQIRQEEISKEFEKTGFYKMLEAISDRPRQSKEVFEYNQNKRKKHEKILLLKREKRKQGEKEQEQRIKERLLRKKK